MCFSSETILQPPIPVIITAHSVSGGPWNIAKYALSIASRVICVSRYVKEGLKRLESKYGLNYSEKMIIIHNAVTINKFPPFNREEFRGRFALPEEKIVLFVGRLAYEKGIHVFINALPKVLEKVNAKFVVVGNGYMKEQFSNLVKGTRLAPKVLFTGFVDDETLRNLQRCAHVCVVPSIFEPFGIVAIDAMAAESPVVVSDTGGLSEIVEHDVTGVKVYPNNPDSLAWGITRVLLDENYANRLKNNAYKKVQEKYNWDKIIRQTKTVYETVLKEF